MNGLWPATGPAPSAEDVIGGISAIIWALTLLPLIKYVRGCTRCLFEVLISLSFRSSLRSSLLRPKVNRPSCSFGVVAHDFLQAKEERLRYIRVYTRQNDTTTTKTRYTSFQKRRSPRNTDRPSPRNCNGHSSFGYVAAPSDSI